MQHHVHRQNKYKDMVGYVQTKPVSEPPTDGNFGIYSVDCEMVRSMIVYHLTLTSTYMFSAMHRYLSRSIITVRVMVSSWQLILYWLWLLSVLGNWNLCLQYNRVLNSRLQHVDSIQLRLSSRTDRAEVYLNRLALFVHSTCFLLQMLLSFTDVRDKWHNIFEKETKHTQFEP